MRIKKIEDRHQGILIPLPNNNHKNISPEKLALSMKHAICLVAAKDILYLKADGNYTHVYMKNGKEHISSTHLKKFADKLGEGFMRVHQSYLIQAKSILSFNLRDSTLELQMGKKIPVSRNKKAMVNDYLKQWLV